MAAHQTLIGRFNRFLECEPGIQHRRDILGTNAWPPSNNGVDHQLMAALGEHRRHLVGDNVVD